MHRVSRALAIALLASAPAAGAATLTAVPDAYYANGYYWAVFGAETTITITGDSEGAAAAYGIYGDLVYDAAISTTLRASQTQHTTDGVPWTLGHLSLADGQSTVFNQFACCAPGTVDQLQIATLTLIFDAVGFSDFYWGSETDFFGLTSADLPSPAFTIACCLDEPIPEPATGALLAFGLLALAWERRRASR